MESKIIGASKLVLTIMIRKLNHHYVIKTPYLAVEVRHFCEGGIKACNQYVINLVVRLLLFIRFIRLIIRNLLLVDHLIRIASGVWTKLKGEELW